MLIHHLVLDVLIVIYVQLIHITITHIWATIYSDTGGYYMWVNGMGHHPEYVNNSTVDGDIKYGSALSFPRRGVTGRTYSEGTYCGSRSFSSDSNTARAISVISKRWATITSRSGEGYWIAANGETYHTEYTHHSKVDGDTKYGKVFGFPRRPVVGGTYYSSTSCGSRSMQCDGSTAYTHNGYS